MQSIDEFTPSTTEPVFGSGLVSQTKSQLSTNNDISDNEKIIPLSESVVNGQDNKSTSNENITNGTTEAISDNTGEGDSSVVHVNGDNEKPTVETNSEVQPAEESSVTEEPSQVESTVPSAEPEPVVSTPVDTVNEGSSSVPTTTTPVHSQPPVAVEPPTTTIDDNVPEAPVATESEKVETKSKSPRGKAKPPVVPITPTRQSSRGRQAASSSSTNVEENPTIDDTGSTTPSSSQNELSKPKKRQAAAIAKDAIAASNQPNSTSGSSNADDGNDQDVILSDGDEDDDVTVGKSKKASPSRKKRGASTSGANATKKARGKNSITSSGDGDSGAGTSEGETTPTPPKKARTSSIKKTPEPPSGEEYVRKLRPRK